MNHVLALRSRAFMIEKFGEQLTTCVEDLNELCRKFFQFINDQVFENEQEWQHALSVFRKRVYDAAGGTPNDKNILVDQIKSILLNPSKLVTGKRRIAVYPQNIVTLLTQGSCDANSSRTKCSVCNQPYGLMVRCSFQRCKKPLHIACAESTLSKKFQCHYYRCPVCLSDKSDKNMLKQKRRPYTAKAIEKQTHNSKGVVAYTPGDAAGLMKPGNRASECSMSSHGEEEDIDKSGDVDTSDGSGTDASGKSNSGIDAPPEPLLEKCSIYADYISEGCMFDASNTLKSQRIRIEGSFNVRVHDTADLLDEYCGWVSLLEAANCRTASYGRILPDDSASLRKSIVDFITLNLDTCCEGRCFGLSGTWREEISLTYFPENQNPSGPRNCLLIHYYRTEREEHLFLDSINDYLKALAMPLTRIDAFVLLAFARMWDVRVVNFCRDGEGWTSNNCQFMPEKYLDEEQSIYLVWTGQRIKWAHADGQDCGVNVSCRESGKRITAHHEFLNYRCDDESDVPSATALTAIPSATTNKDTHYDPNQHEGMQAGHEAVKLTEIVASLKMILDGIKSGFGDLSNLVKGIHSACEVSSVADCSPMDVTEEAIRILVALNSGLQLTSLQMEEWYGILRNRGIMLSQMYHENDFKVMVDETITFLKQYSGRQILDDRDLAVFHEHLKTYGWVLSPQMWTREEIVVMCVILLDSNLLFNNVLQKITQIEEKDQNRGMACLDPRVQAIMYLRLKDYKFVLEDKHLPIDVPAAVVLNSGGSYLHLATWEYPVNCRFVVDDKVDAVLFEVTNTPAYTYCNGLFIATKTRRPNGQPVYVSISPPQFFGPRKEDKPLWDSVPMKKYLSKDHVLHGYFSAKRWKNMQKKKGLSFPAERVLYWEDGKAVFQSVTAYGTEMKLLTVDCEKLGVEHSTTKWSRISNFDFKNKMSIMVPGLEKKTPEISRINYKGTIDPECTFACGTERIAVRVKKTVSKSRPKPTKKQCFHKDGPTLYDEQQFDCHGNILPDARGDTIRSTSLPPGISVSALFAFFCRTFLGIKPVESISKRARPCSTGSLRLHASIGRAIIFNFDTDHQVWRHKMCMTYMSEFNVF